MTLSPEITLYSTVVQLIAQQDGVLPATQGRLAHAAFLDIMRAVDPDLAAALHAGSGRKPFTVSPLHGLGVARDGQVTVHRGRTAWLRFTLLGGHLFAAFTRRFLLPPSLGRLGTMPPRGTRWPVVARAGEGVTIRIGPLDFAISEVLTTPGSHPWAGYTSLARLQQDWRARALDPETRSITLQFASPTVFSFGTRAGLGKWMEPFPAPALLFGSLAAAWNQVAGPQALDKAAVRTYAEETVVIGLYRMASRMVHYWGQPQIGAVGSVTYLLKDRRDQAMIRTLNMLADFAFYSGVGYKTTMGMGQVRRVVG